MIDEDGDLTILGNQATSFQIVQFLFWAVSLSVVWLVDSGRAGTTRGQGYPTSCREPRSGLATKDEHPRPTGASGWRLQRRTPILSRFTRTRGSLRWSYMQSGHNL